MDTKKSNSSFRTEASGMVIALLAEFLFGIYTTLFVQFPEGASEKALWKFSSSNIVLSIHMLLGLIITLGSIVFFIRAIARKETTWIIASSIVAVGALIATVGGMLFVPSQSDTYSYLMSVGFVIAIFGYGWGIYKTTL